MAASEFISIRDSRPVGSNILAEMQDSLRCGMPGRMGALCGKPGGYMNAKTISQATFVFLSLQVIEAAINFGTHCSPGVIRWERLA